MSVCVCVSVRVESFVKDVRARVHVNKIRPRRLAWMAYMTVYFLITYLFRFLRAATRGDGRALFRKLLQCARLESTAPAPGRLPATSSRFARKLCVYDMHVRAHTHFQLRSASAERKFPCRETVNLNWTRCDPLRMGVAVVLAAAVAAAGSHLNFDWHTLSDTVRVSLITQSPAGRPQLKSTSTFRSETLTR